MFLSLSFPALCVPPAEPLQNTWKRRQQMARVVTVLQSLCCPPPPIPILGQRRGWGFLLSTSHQRCAHSKSWLLPRAPALAKKENKKHITLPFHREPKLAQHSISRQNVCYHQIYPSSLGGDFFFASLTCVGKWTANSLLSESTLPWRSKVYSLVFKSSLFILTVPIYGKKMARC